MPFRTMAGGYVTSPSLDDRCGMAAILCAMEELQGQALPCSLSVLFSTQEELGSVAPRSVPIPLRRTLRWR